MEVWIFETHDPDSSDVDCEVFSTQEFAQRKACYCAKVYMMDRGIDDPDNEEHQYYEDFCNFVSQKDYRLALREYASWQDNCLDYEAYLYYNVYKREVIDYDDSGLDSTAKSQVATNTITAEPQKPCKQCSHNVTASEPICWWCGIDNPGK